MPITVEVTGDFLVESSLARVNRGLFGALARRPEVDLAILAEPTAAQITGSTDDVLLEQRRRKRFSPDPQVTIRHRWPAVFPRVRSGAYVHMQPWEFGSLPAPWAAEAREVADEIWCYSHYVAAMYVRAGISKERVHVVPLGYDPAIFKPGPAPKSARLRDRCVFLYVGDTIARKGVDVAVNAYMAAFRPNDEVVLVVKDFGSKAKGDDTRLRDQIAGLGARRDIPPILYIDTVYSDVALAELYRASSAIVAPYRGEGFGLPILEAMACGVATIATRGGASDDFTTDQTTFHIDASPVKLGRKYGGFELVDEAVLLEPIEQQVADAMLRIFRNPAEAKAMGARAAEVASGWTWEHGAACAVERLTALAAKEPLSTKRSPDSREVNRFELKIESRGGEDGILLELFRRIGTLDPFYVECVSPGSSPSTTVFLARSLGWRGVVIEGTSAAYAQLAQTLKDKAVPADFDLLVLGPGGDPAWARLGSHRPKAIVATNGGSAPRALARSQGYAPLGVESSGASAFFVRDDLLERTRFAAVAD